MLKGLVVWSNKLREKNEIHGVVVARGGLRISLLLFADDCILFYQVQLGECEKMLELLSVYEMASSQALNIQKIPVLLSKNTSSSSRTSISREVEVVASGKYEKYFSLPALIGRYQYNTFRYI